MLYNILYQCDGFSVWLVNTKKRNMEEIGINSYFILSQLMSIWNHIKTHNKSRRNKYIFRYTDEITTVSRAARTVCGYIIIDSKIIIPQKMTNTF